MQTLDLFSSKTCSKCSQKKCLSDFHVRRASVDGLAYKCKACVRGDVSQWRSQNPDGKRLWAERNKEHVSKEWKRWSGENYSHLREKQRQWQQANPDYGRSSAALRKAIKLQATPAWADRLAMREIYKVAELMTQKHAVKYEVDHFYPLKSDKVCGLHCEANLQVITQFENRQKHTAMPEDYYEA